MSLRALKRKGLPVLLSALYFASAAFAQTQRGPSTPEERARALQVARELRTDPASPSTRSDREWFVKWLIEVPDISIPLCSEMLGGTLDPKDPKRGALVAAMMAGETSFVIENPAKTKDKDAIYIAGAEAMLDAYKAMRAKDSTFVAGQLDEFEKARSEGRLEDAVRSKAKKCKRG